MLLNLYLLLKSKSISNTLIVILSETSLSNSIKVSRKYEGPFRVLNLVNAEPKILKQIFSWFATTVGTNI